MYIPLIPLLGGFLIISNIVNVLIIIITSKGNCDQGYFTHMLACPHLPIHNSITTQRPEQITCSIPICTFDIFILKHWGSYENKTGINPVCTWLMYWWLILFNVKKVNNFVPWFKKEEVLFNTPAFSTRRNLRAANNHLPFFSPQKTPGEVV